MGVRGVHGMVHGPPVDVPATPIRCSYGQFNRIILGRRRRVAGSTMGKRKKGKRRTKNVNSLGSIGYFIK